MLKRFCFFQNTDFSAEKTKEKRKIQKFKNSKKVVESDGKKNEILVNNTQQFDKSIMNQSDTSNQNQFNISNQNQLNISTQNQSDISNQNEFEISAQH